MTDDELEDLAYRLLDEFEQSIGAAFNDEKKFSFIAGARSALHLISTTLSRQLANDTSKLEALNSAASNPVRENLKVLHASRMSALHDFIAALRQGKRE